MSPADFRLLADPGSFSVPLQALWKDAHGDWDAAHTLAQNANNRDGDWVHAYLHRKEGDVGNAGYWYTRAKKSPPAKGVDLESEWTAIVAALLKQTPSA